jgi:hypothetical protein
MEDLTFRLNFETDQHLGCEQACMAYDWVLRFACETIVDSLPGQEGGKYEK